jgi:Raf kinase inhibitor-like YbhB/YbcL family protein
MDLLFILFLSFALQTSTLEVTSPDFVNDGEIPARFACDGEGVNPALNIKGIPENAMSLALIVEDPDAPLTNFSHWLVWNIPPQETIQQNSIPGIQGNNSIGKNSYTSPCPPAGTHRYFFKVYALDTLLDLKVDANKKMLETAMQGHILSRGEIIGRYNRK